MGCSDERGGRRTDLDCHGIQACMPSMPTPTFALRLSKKTQDDLAALAAVYGSPNPRAFAREILEVVTSGDMERITAFGARLVERMGGQMAFLMTAQVDAPASSHGARTTRNTRKPRKRRRARDRTT